MSAQVILPDTPSATSLPALAVGATPCALPDGQRTDLFGRAVAHASHSARPVPGGALPTNAISGLLGSSSSASADLTLSLVSKLKQQLTTDGSTLFNLTWREKVTPAGRLVCRLAASGRRISDSDFGLWPTPNTMEGGQTSRSGKRKGELLMGGLVGWPTPIVGDTTGGPRPPDDKRGPVPGLQTAANLTSWPTTSTRDYKGGYQGGAHEERQDQPRRIGRGGAINFWSDCDWLPCRDGKARPVEPGTFPLAYGISGRVGRLRAYGNAIVPQVAQVFIEAYLES